MTSAQVLACFDRVAEAPDAIRRLRRFIIELGVRGKLIEQDPSDEPASSLLNRIQGQKDRLQQAETIKRSESLARRAEDDSPFPMPSGWSWARFIDVAAIRSNLVNPKVYGNWPHIAPDNIESGTGRLLPHTTIAAAAVSSSKHLFSAGCILYSKIRPALAKVVVVDFDGLCSADMYPIQSFIYREYLQKYMLSDAFVQQSVREDTRVAMPKINQASLSTILVAVPPLPEQYRIVSKVDELMALCDRLEAAQAEREARRGRVVVASLQRLSQPAPATSDEAFRETARFYLGHLPRLAIRSEHIQQLRQTILDLAVRGPLVPHDPNDEPATERLRLIAAEKKQVISTAEEDAQRTVRASDEAFALPASWVWTTLGDVAWGFRYGTSAKCAYGQPGEAVLRIPNISNGRISIDDLKYGSLPPREIDALRLRLGDILMVRSNGSLNLVGRAALVEPHVVGYCYAGYLVRVRTCPSHIDTRYLLLALGTAHVRAQIEIPIRTTVGLKNVNASELAALTIPLPPLAEQRRIVAKVDELMTVCDQLEAQLTATAIDSRRLLEAVLEEAMRPTRRHSEAESDKPSAGNAAGGG